MIFKNKKIFVKQQEQLDCGVACIQMILKNYGSERPLYVLRELTMTDTKGVSAFGIKKCLEGLNFQTKILKVDKSLWKLGREIFPLIANVTNEVGEGHYVVVFDIKKDNLIIGDPAKGILNISIENFEKIWNHIAIIIKPTPYYIPKTIKVGGLTSFFSLVKESKIFILKATLLSLLVTFISIFTSLYFQLMIDNILPSKKISLVNFFSLCLILSYAIKTTLEYLKNRILINIGIEMNKKIVLQYFSHLLSLPLNFFNSRKNGDVISRFLDASRIVDALASGSIAILLDSTMFIIIGIFLYDKNNTLFLISILPVPIYVLIIIYFSRKFQINNEVEMSYSSRLNSQIIENLNGIETIKSFQIEKFVYNKLQRNLSDYFTRTKLTNRLTILQELLVNFIDLLGSTLILSLGFNLLINKEISLGEIISYNSLYLYFTTPIKNILSLQNKVQAADIASVRLNEILSVKIEETKSLKNIKKIEKGITVKNLNFSYNSDSIVLNNISFKIRNNQKIAIVGMSGSGKSTLAKLLIKFHNTSSSSIFIDDIPINNLSSRSVRQLITYVSQQDFLFKGSIYENLIFGNRQNFSKGKINKIINLVEIADFINKLPNGLNTKIEEGGANLSGGQIKRLILARALLRDSQYYIFDEITNGLDAELEDRIIKNLINSKKTIIFITHSLPIAKRCDNIIYLKNGEIIESGSYEKLMNYDSNFKILWKNLYS